MPNSDFDYYREVIQLIPQIQEAADNYFRPHVKEKTWIKAKRRLIRETYSLIQGKWTIDVIFIVRMLEEPYFNDIRRAVPDINSRTLTDRLRHLEKSGIILRTIHEEPQLRVTYKLTEFGVGLMDMLLPFMVYYILPKKHRQQKNCEAAPVKESKTGIES